MAKNPIDQDLSDAYERHGGPLKAFKHFGKSRGKKMIGKGKDMVKHFRDKISGMKQGEAKMPADKGAAFKAGAKSNRSTQPSRAIRERMQPNRMRSTKPMMKDNLPARKSLRERMTKEEGKK